MPTYAPSSGTIRASDIRSAFGITGALSLGAQRSKTYWRADAYKGTLPASTIKMSSFYSKGSTTPVTATDLYLSAYNGTTQGATYTYTYTVPLYYQLVITCRGAGGGGGGGGGATYNPNGTLQSTGDGSPGSAGQNTSFASMSGPILVAYGGGGGSAGTAGANGAGTDNIAVGGAGGSSGYVGVSAGGKGGNGGYSALTVLSPVNGGTGPAVGSTITITVGMGGSGGNGYGTGGSGSPGRYGEFAVYPS